MTVSETKVTALPDIYRKAAEELGYQLVDVNGESQIGISLGYIEIFLRSTSWLRDVCVMIYSVCPSHKPISFFLR